MVDKNKTVWQRLALALKDALPEEDDREVARLTAELHPYVVAERRDSRKDLP